MSTPEGLVKSRVKRLLKKYKVYQHWPVQTGYGAACLDCHACHNGRYFAIETKAPGRKPTPRQRFTMDEIEMTGGKVFVIGEEWNEETQDYSGMAELGLWLESAVSEQASR